ncbi:formylglycine-generating enzyme family protein [Chloroflexi bacterium TSY]|nr:formylglycine-generating enzyme family protein [Chloroflexi bacterium TSY]
MKASTVIETEAETLVEKIVIPAGPFCMGEKSELVEVPAFQMSKYPVTNADYYHFVVATGHRCPDHWMPDGTYPPELAQHPVVFVSWESAVAYTEWLGARLPSEAEWEKAARGTDGRTYPWGNEFVAANCNTSESGTDGTRPVDAHLGGVSPYGVMDMAGNNWEWTTTYYQDDEEWRVLKGGAWDYKGIKDTRCFYRVYFRPDFRNSAVGLRCCWDSL